MKPNTLLTALFCGLLWGNLSVLPARAQIELVRSDFFPADLEFKELVRVLPVPGPLAVTPPASEAWIFDEVGYRKYERRNYETESRGALTIEIVTGKDERSAFSLLTLLRNSELTPGPPGDSFAAGAGALEFAKGNFWVRVRCDGAADLVRRVAISVGNHMGQREHSTPPLVSHFPGNGLDASSERYFLGPKSFAAYASKIPGLQLDFRPEMEVAQAAYTLGNGCGVLSLVNFPTAQMAEDYFDSISDGIQSQSNGLFTRKVGPIVGILEGSFDAAAADQILGAIKFRYSIKWIYDKNNRSSATVWGVPVRILGTVVRSLLLTALLCGISILLGVGMAVFRVFLRGYAPGNILDAPERTGMIRLRLSEERAQSTGTAVGRGPTETK